MKWLNVFQEASFSLDRDTGRCVGSVTWTDRLIHSMNSGFFRLLDAGRYMELDGITSKHLYRFLAVVFDKTDVVLIDARKLATENLGIVNLPRYFSRLLQTLEPAFDQLVRGQVLASYHIVDAEQWRIALHRHPDYVPERKTLLLEAANTDTEFQRVQAAKSLEEAGVIEYQQFRQELAATRFSDLSENRRRLQQERFQRIALEMREREADELILQDLAKAETPPFNKRCLRRRAEQAVLTFCG